jgi:endonuclease/exonuclease/phosphatase family metal-dependent hydrolase
MTRAFVLAGVLLVGICGAQEGIHMKVLCYNTHHGEGTDGVLDLARIARVINSESPDLVGLQEIDSVCGRTNRVDQLAEYARLTSMNGVFGWAMPFDGGGYGNAILSKGAIGTVRRVPVPWNDHMALFVDVTAGSGSAATPMTFITTHWHVSDPAARLQSATIINSTVTQQYDAQRPMVLCGDMNSRAGSAPIIEMDKEWEITDFNFGIDWIVCRPASNRQVVSVRKLTTGDAVVASDHAPVVMELAYLDAPTRTGRGPGERRAAPDPTAAARTILQLPGGDLQENVFFMNGRMARVGPVSASKSPWGTPYCPLSSGR